MRPDARRTAIFGTLLIWGLGSAPGAVAESASGRGARVPPAWEVLERAFDNFYQCDLQQDVHFVVEQSGNVVLEYQMEMLRKFIEGKAHDLFYVVGDGERRNTKILRIERFDRADDVFVYLPEVRRPRRFPSAQRGDKFFGLELTIEDLEIQRLEKFEVVGRSSDRIDGELAYVVTVQRLHDSGYDRADFFISAKDYAMLQIRFYRRGKLEPYKFAYARREWMEHYGDRVLPRRMDFEDLSLNTRTTILFLNRRVDPDLPDAHFSTLSLEKRVPLSRFRDRETGSDSE